MDTASVKYQPRMAPNQPGKLNIKRTVLLSLGFMSVLAGLGYYNLAVPLLLGDIEFGLVPKDILVFGAFGQQTVIGAILVLDNILALLLQPFFANLSDRAKSKYGRRMPFIILGVLSAAFFFIITPLFKVLLGLIAILFCFNIAMALYRSSALTLLADYTPDEVRSKGSGIQQLVANSGAIFAFLLPTIIGILRPGAIKFRCQISRVSDYCRGHDHHRDSPVSNHQGNSDRGWIFTHQRYTDRDRLDHLRTSGIQHGYRDGKTGLGIFPKGTFWKRSQLVFLDGLCHLFVYCFCFY